MDSKVEPKHLITVTKALAGGTEQIEVKFNIDSLEDLDAGVEKAYVTIDKRAEVIKAEMRKIEEEIKAKMQAEKDAK